MTLLGGDVGGRDSAAVPMGQELVEGLTPCGQGSSPTPEGCPACRG